MRSFRPVLALLLLLPKAVLACGVIAQAAPRIMHASFDSDAPALAVTFLGHASFLLETPGHVTVVTDYNGYNIPAAPPLVATMNHAHSTHYTDTPDPRVAHILRGWRDDGAPAQWDVTYGDLRIRNLATNTRDWEGGTTVYGNSVFVFEAAGLCVAHLSHLHHLLTPEDLAVLGPIDVVMAPVDGIWTLSHKDVAEVLDQLHAPLVIPMHYYTTRVLNQFLEVVRGRYDVRRAGSAHVDITRAGLPQSPEIMILDGF